MGLIGGYGRIMGMRLVGLFWGDSVESGFEGYGWDYGGVWIGW